MNIVYIVYTEELRLSVLFIVREVEGSIVEVVEYRFHSQRNRNVWTRPTAVQIFFYA